MTRVLVTGLGMLGFPLAKYLLEQGFEVYGITRTPMEYLSPANFPVFYVDITDLESVVSVFKRVRPDYVVHTAAVTNVDFCEKNRHVAYSVNVFGTRNIVSACEQVGCGLVYFSTDYVFDGTLGSYSELDVAQPINVYGRTKLIAERVVGDARVPHWILRISTPYHLPTPRNNFLLWLLHALSNRDVIHVVSDQYTTPTCGFELFDVVRRIFDTQPLFGIYHVGGRDRLSRYDFALRVAKVFGYDPSLVRETVSENMSWIAPRPKDSSLVSKRAMRYFNISFDSVARCLRKYAKIYQSGRW